MILLLKREQDDGVGIRGTISDKATGKFLGYTMEPSVSRATHPGIPIGLYALAWTKSTRLKRETLEVVQVPAVLKPRKPVWKFPLDWRGGIRIHPLNSPDESLGCIGIGLSRTSGMFIGSSRIATGELEKYARGAMTRGEPVYLEVS